MGWTWWCFVAIRAKQKQHSELKRWIKKSYIFIYKHKQVSLFPPESMNILINSFLPFPPWRNWDATSFESLILPFLSGFVIRRIACSAALSVIGLLVMPPTSLSGRGGSFHSVCGNGRSGRVYWGPWSMCYAHARGKSKLKDDDLISQDNFGGQFVSISRWYYHPKRIIWCFYIIFLVPQFYYIYTYNGTS